MKRASLCFNVPGSHWWDRILLETHAGKGLRAYHRDSQVWVVSGSPVHWLAERFRIPLAFWDCDCKRKTRGILSVQAGIRVPKMQWILCVCVCVSTFSSPVFFQSNDWASRVSMNTRARTLNLALNPEGAEQAICCNPSIKFLFFMEGHLLLSTLILVEKLRGQAD